MKKVALGVLLVFMLLALTGCSAAMKDYVIKVDGTEGATFEGTYMYQVDRTPTSETLSGTVPAEYSVQGEVLSCQIVKTSADGTIKVTLTANGEVIDEGEITEQGGEVVVND